MVANFLFRFGDPEAVIVGPLANIFPMVTWPWLGMDIRNFNLTPQSSRSQPVGHDPFRVGE